MSEKIIFAIEDKLAVINDKNITYLNSQHLKRYHNNMADLKKKQAWKTEGSGAAFMGAHSPLAHYSSEQVRARISGITAVPKVGKILYSININEFSGIFIKNPSDDMELEGLVTSDRDAAFYAIDFNENSEKITASIGEGSLEKHIGILSMNSGGYTVLTEGESIDENPCWSKTNDSRIYYDSAGIAVNGVGESVGMGTRAILRLDIDKGELEEVIAIKKFDCIKPREDAAGNLYFIKKPQEELHKNNSTLKDVLLMPFRLLKAVFGWMNFFTAKYTGETLNSAGQNPARSKQKTEEEIFIEGNLINAEKSLKENQAAGEKYPGVAPRSWELIRRSPEGIMRTIKKGVIDFDIDNEGNIVFSNGKYLVKMQDSSSEEVLGKVNMASKVRII